MVLMKAAYHSSFPFFSPYSYLYTFLFSLFISPILAFRFPCFSHISSFLTR